MPLTEEILEQPDSPLVHLQQALYVLIPIRRQRLHRAQRLQQQQQTHLFRSRKQYQAEQQQLIQEQRHYQYQRDCLPKQQPSREALTRHVDRTRRALQTVGKQQQLCQQAEHACQQATSAVKQAQQWTHEQQKALEKLEYLSAHLEDAS